MAAAFDNYCSPSVCPQCEISSNVFLELRKFFFDFG